MKKDKEHGHLTIMEKDSGSSDNGESLQVYMKVLQKLPLLSREEETRLARQIRDSKGEIIDLLCSTPETLSEIYALRELSATEIRKLLFTKIDTDEEGKETGEVPALLQEMEAMTVACLKKKKGAKETLAAFLKGMNFTLQDLQRLSAPLKDCGTKAQKTAITKQLAAFKTSKNKMVEGNLRLVFARAKRFMGRGMSLEDLLQEGNIGLIKAIEKFDVEKGWKFGTYATWWIDQALGRSVADKGRLIRIPVHMVENINKLTRANRNLSQKAGEAPTMEELTKASGLSEDKIEKVRKIASFPQQADDPSVESGLPLSEVLTDVETPDPYQVLERKELALRVRSMLSRLEPREQKVLRMRFGIGEKSPKILKEIGKLHNISRERVRQILDVSLTKLQANQSDIEDWAPKNKGGVRA